MKFNFKKPILKKPKDLRVVQSVQNSIKNTLSSNIRKPLSRPASLKNQRIWRNMPQTSKNVLKKFLPDSDRDGVPNGFDCQPFNPKKQDDEPILFFSSYCYDENKQQLKTCPNEQTINKLIEGDIDELYKRDITEDVLLEAYKLYRNNKYYLVLYLWFKPDEEMLGVEIYEITKKLYEEEPMINLVYDVFYGNKFKSKLYELANKNIEPRYYRIYINSKMYTLITRMNEYLKDKIKIKEKEGKLYLDYFVYNEIKDLVDCQALCYNVDGDFFMCGEKKGLKKGDKYLNYICI